ncbi:MAG: Nif11-like leader peptide family RiPP precursor [Anaerolineae bacterium]|jgi:predicted ribosomally synthesized peptide with nif11-like leader|nr:Nif11-like leader peptide family RiPP precursor [Anaerolineae bacterium]
MSAIELFLEKMTDPEFQAAFVGAESLEAKAAVLAQAGLTLSVAEAEAALVGQELSDEDLDQVAGGGAGIIRYPPQ